MHIAEDVSLSITYGANLSGAKSSAFLVQWSMHIFPKINDLSVGSLLYVLFFC